ncbi:Sir2 histone deacetylase Hst2 [Rhodosporidiobolus nylandii]
MSPSSSPPRKGAAQANRAYPHLTVGDEPELEDVARLIREGKAKRIMVMAGAGISTSAGIPDFRSPGTGLYDNLANPEAIFDIDYFEERPEAFFTLAKELYPSNFKPTTAHYFFRLLQERGVLKGIWTQNIDTLERIAGIEDDLIVEAHGSFASAECLNCRKGYTAEEIKERIMEGEVVRCEEKGCIGKKGALIKPKIVFFGEGLPDRFFSRMSHFSSCDLLIVLGTSLSVGPFNSLLHRVPSTCPRVLINLEPVGEAEHPRDSGFDFEGITLPAQEKGIRDVCVLGSADEGVEELCRLVGNGWTEELEKLKRDGWVALDADETNSVVEAEAKREEVVVAVVEATKTVEEDDAVRAPKEGEEIVDGVVDQLAKAVESVELGEEVDEGAKKSAL